MLRHAARTLAGLMLGLLWRPALGGGLHLLILGDDSAALMRLRMSAADDLLRRPGTVVTMSGTDKQPSHGEPLGEQAYKLAQMAPRLRGQERCVLLERHARNTAQKIVFTSRMWAHLGVPADAEVAVVVNAFMEARMRRLLGLAAEHFPWWGGARLVLAPDPGVVRWRQEDEIRLHLPHVQRDLDEALALDSRPATATCAAL